MMTPNPCYDETTRTDCPRRHVGCRADCPEWQAWEKVHAEETAAIRNKREAYDSVENFLSNQNRRVQLSGKRDRMRKYRRER